MTQPFTPSTLPAAIRSLLELNEYDVQGPLQVHGAEVDLRAISKTDPFGAPLYIEVTIEHVDNTKYGKDVSKFMLLRSKEPECRCVIVSASGFTDAVSERAVESRIQTFTYEEFFARFQRFDRYARFVLDEGAAAAELERLEGLYEEPLFNDTVGREPATPFLSSWVSQAKPDGSWLIVVGEYGTGKTALTKVLLRRWMALHRQTPAAPIPFRIELRDFQRQFDARTLLHHFRLS
jgi:hypothetical protein